LRSWLPFGGPASSSSRKASTRLVSELDPHANHGGEVDAIEMVARQSDHGGVGVEGAPAARRTEIASGMEPWFPGVVAKVACGAELCSN
jgi:hypothetical protein